MKPTINITVTSEDANLASRMAQHITWSLDPKNYDKIRMVFEMSKMGVPAEAGSYLGQRVHIATNTGNVSDWLHDARKAYDDRKSETERSVP